MRRVLITAALAVLGCGADIASQAPEEPKPFVLATFTGEVDAATETFTIQYEPTALGQALGMTALVIPSGTPGVTLGNVPGSLWNHAQTGCGTTYTSGGSVRVTSNYPSPTVLGKVFAEITMLTPMSAAACNSDTAIPGVTAVNGGLWSYGDIAAAGQADKAWAFTWSSGVRSTFKGRIVAFQVDAWSAKVPAVSNLGDRMAGTGTSAVFIETGSNRLALVNAAGTVTESSLLSAAPTGVATSADGSRIWVSLGSVNRIARLDATGQLVGAEIPVAVGGPQGVAVDPISGVVWFALPGSGSFGGVGWYDPATQQQGVINAGGNGGGVSPIVAVNLGGRCSLYTGTRLANRLRRIDCTAKTSLGSFVLGTACGSLATGYSMVPGASGDVWLTAQNATGGTICLVSGATTTQPFSSGSSATFSALAYGPDGNLWTMNNGSGLCRIWLGTAGRGTRTCFGALVPSTVNYGMVSGAGAIWAPRASSTAGTSDLTRVIP